MKRFHSWHFPLAAVVAAFGGAGVAEAAPFPVAVPSVASQVVTASVVPPPNPARDAAQSPAAAPQTRQAGDSIVVADAPVPRARPFRRTPPDAAVASVPVTPSAPPPASSVTPAAPAASARAAASASAAIGTTGSGPSFSNYGSRAGDLKQALDALRRDDYETTFVLRNGLSDPFDRKIVDWALARSGSPKVSSAMITEFAASAPGWPDPEEIRANAEAALLRENPPAATVVRSFSGSMPVSAAGAIVYTRALVSTGDRNRAASVIRSAWHTKSMSGSEERQILSEFSGLLRPEDHMQRAEMLLYSDRASAAEDLKPYVSSADRAYIDARAAVVRNAGNAASKLSQVPASARNRPGYLFAQIAYNRRRENYREAAALLQKAPRNEAALIDPDEWWVERRIVSRGLVEEGDPRTAYAIAAGHAAESPHFQAEAEFHAGWYALRFLNDPGRAARHFKNIEDIGTTPITLSRAYYWQGRAAEAAGNSGRARSFYRQAGTYGMTYYGQLAREKLGQRNAGVGRPASAGIGDTAAFTRNELVIALNRLIAAGHAHRTWPLFDHLSETVPSAGQIALLSEMANRAGMPHIALLVSKEGLNRGLAVDGLAFPTEGIPASTRMPAGLDRAVVYAIARQESTFNPGAISPAGARGLLQLMPGTARATASSLGLAYQPSRLTSDASYNATLGAAHLKELIDKFDGSYVLTFAAYNAGSSRAYEWIQRFGDPRDPRVDAIDWVESIPYGETRNYVQRVMENTQVYRERLGTGRLSIEEDLKRGTPG
ncbi:lytic transglycosylase domain-containing protein [Amorphus orientalis]|uniref:Soluble lytic murein transglycosylase n=1 Tax=Amorphus orientalis TaxID=649198 RepID=A0AAE3VMI7_9HYPH|nr:lytic transglycosylase domain-containing protein [Amorphus orientalis]MDQ0314798.1 soluble lytic murein transglycosylase [Amorphus orientalis]